MVKRTISIGVLIIVLSGLSVGPLHAETKQEALERLKGEPTCPQVQKEALAYFSINKERINSFRRGASAKAAVPVLEVSGGYVDSKLDESTWDYIAYDTDQWLSKGAGGRAWDARGKLSWNLPQLVFNAEVLDVASLAGLVQSVLKEVTRLYYMRRRLQLDLILNPPADEATRLTKELRLEELTALLDAMTGGYFQRELTRRALTVPPGEGSGNDALFEQ